MRLEQKISEKLTSLNIMPNLQGFDYLKTAILLCYENKSYIHGITKTLYPELAKIYNSTPSKIERSIRHAISKFEHPITNSAFIALIAEQLRYEV